MKTYKSLVIAVIMLTMLGILPGVLAAGAGGSLGGDIGVEEFAPIVWQCGNRVLSDDEVQPWRTSKLGEKLVERNQQYLFEGEKYQVDVVVMDKNKIEDVMVDLILGEEAGDVEYNINCIRASRTSLEGCNARIGEEAITQWDSATMEAYTCTITILDSEHMYGEYWMAIQADDGEETGIYDEVAKWFINPMISLNVDGALDFSDVRPGTASYSTILLENTAEGGVILDMFITGDDWPAADASLGRCAGVDGSGNPTGTLVNYLPLGAFRYYAENGAYSTRDDAVTNGAYSSVIRAKDSEGYVNINQQINAGFEEAMFNDAEIIQANPFATGGSTAYYANLLYAGSTGMSVTFRLMLPEPCYGNFESEADGSIFIWGEAI